MIILINFIFFYKNSIDIFFKYRKQKLPNNIQIDTDLVSYLIFLAILIFKFHM